MVVVSRSGDARSHVGRALMPSIRDGVSTGRTHLPVTSLVVTGIPISHLLRQRAGSSPASEPDVASRQRASEQAWLKRHICERMRRSGEMKVSIELVKRARPRFLWPLGLVLIASLLVVPLIGFPRAASAAVIASDDFNRADGGLGTGWTAISDGAMTISSQAVIGAVGATTGDIRTAEAYPSDQYSAVDGDLDAADRGPVDRRRRCGCSPAGGTGTRAFTTGTSAARS